MNRIPPSLEVNYAYLAILPNLAVIQNGELHWIDSNWSILLSETQKMSPTCLIITPRKVNLFFNWQCFRNYKRVASFLSSFAICLTFRYCSSNINIRNINKTWNMDILIKDYRFYYEFMEIFSIILGSIGKLPYFCDQVWSFFEYFIIFSVVTYHFLKI